VSAFDLFHCRAVIDALEEANSEIQRSVNRRQVLTMCPEAGISQCCALKLFPFPNFLTIHRNARRRLDRQPYSAA
jgi:hypothetical protein